MLANVWQCKGSSRVDQLCEIARFLAKRYGLAGSNDIENADIAGIIESCSDDLGFQLMNVWHEKDVVKLS